MSALLQRMRAFNPQGLWPLDDASGAAQDVSGGGYHATVAGAPTRRQTQRGINGTNFVAPNDSFNIGTTFPELYASNFTMMALIQTSETTLNKTIFRWESATAGQGLLRIDKTTGDFLLYIAGSGGDYWKTSAIPVHDGVVHHLACVRNRTAGTGHLFLDGVELSGTLKGTTTAGSGSDPAPGYSQGGWQIGRWGGGTIEHYQGWMSHAAVYPAALTSDQIALIARLALRYATTY